jgi:ABC-type nitrate/sulfonate/bicarbonate transport system ATPase subunit
LNLATHDPDHAASTAPAVLVAVERLSRIYGKGASEVRALDGVSLDIRRGEFLSIVGPSGCGKSTLLNILAGFDRPTDGTAVFDGQPIPGPSPRRGVVFQDTNALFPWMTVRRNVGFGLRALKTPRAERERRTAEALALVGLTQFADSFPAQLSGGMRQLAAMARVIVMGADLLLMDEPFAALDAITRQRMQAHLTAIWVQTRSTVMFITHSIEEAIYLGDRVVIMTPRPGRVRDVLEVDLPRPRDVASAAFNALRGTAIRQLGPLAASDGEAF